MIFRPFCLWILFNIHKQEELKSMLDDITDYVISFDSNILASMKSKDIAGRNKKYVSLPFLVLIEAPFSFFSLRAGNL